MFNSKDCEIDFYSKTNKQKKHKTKRASSHYKPVIIRHPSPPMQGCHVVLSLPQTLS